MPGSALRLRCRTRGAGARTGGRVAASMDICACTVRGGDCSDDTSSALPSRERDNLNWEAELKGGGRTDTGELLAGDGAEPGNISSLSVSASNN
jgi:hypothetical protein